MACTVVSARAQMAAAGSEFISELVLSGLTAGLPEQVAHMGPSGCFVDSLGLVVTTPPSDGSLLNVVLDDTDTTNNRVEFRILCPAGGSADGAVVKLRCRFIDQGSGGLSTITTT